MARVKGLIEDKKIKSNVIGKIMNKDPLDAYVLYDKQDDELIFRIVNLDIPTTTYFLSDSVALLVKIEDDEVVGFRFFDFSNTHLPKFSSLYEIWDVEKFSKVFKKYRKVRIDPICKQPTKYPNKPNNFPEHNQIDCIDKAVACAI